MKAALLYAGPHRSTTEIVNNHIQTFGSDIDIYVSCFEHYLNSWKTSGFEVKQYFITPYVDFNKTNWSKYRNDDAGQSGFWQFWNLKNVIEKVPKKYKYYVKCRNDIIFETPFEFDKLLFKKNTLYTPNNSFHKSDWDIDDWLNDEFYIGCENTMKVISMFVTNYYSKFRHEINLSTASNESQLRIYLKECGISVEKLYNIRYNKNHYGSDRPSGYTKFQLEKNLK